MARRDRSASRPVCFPVRFWFVLLLALLCGSAARAEDTSAPEIPGGIIYPGLGLHGYAGPHNGADLSLQLWVEFRQLLIDLEAMSCGGQGKVLFWFGGSAGAVLGSGRHAPFVMGGLGYLSHGMWDQSGYDAVSASGELGWLWFRDRRFLQIASSIRVLLPIHKVSGFGGEPSGAFVMLNLRLLL